MRIWIVGALLVVGVVWVGWARRRTRHRQLAWVLRRSGGVPARARVVVVVSQSVAALLALLALVVGGWAEQEHRLFWVRIPAAVLVIALYVPFATLFAPVRLRLGRFRRSPQQRMTGLGASSDVAAAAAGAGAPFAFVGSLIFLAAVTLAAWHHVR